MNAKISVVVVALVVCGHMVCAQSPPMYVPYQAPPAPRYAPATPPPVQSVPVRPRRQQPTAMYDQSYKGPYNAYGQPAIMGYRRQQDVQRGQAHTINNGIVPRISRGIGSLGNYLWTYMPAPVTGVGSPYDVPPGEAQYSVTFVPGSP